MVQNAMKIQPVFLLGYGGVGRALARQIVAARARHAQRCDLRLDVVGISDSRGARIERAGFSDDALRALDARKTATGSLDRYDAPAPPALDPFVADDLILADTTASDPALPSPRRCMTVAMTRCSPSARGSRRPAE